MRIIATFNKGAPVRHISHLDLMRAVARALRRSGLPVKYSAGFNPHQVLSFASALSVGTTSQGELFDIAMDQPCTTEEFLQKLSREMPPGMELRDAHEVEDNYPALTKVLEGADYRIDLTLEGCFEKGVLEDQLRTLLQNPVLAIKKTKAGPKETDLRELLISVELGETCCAGNQTRVELLLSCVNAVSGALNPSLLLPLVLNAWGAHGNAEICRTYLWRRDGDRKIPLWQQPKCAR